MNLCGIFVLFAVFVFGQSLGEKNTVRYSPDVSLRYNYKPITNAVLINSQWAVTVAHVLRGYSESELNPPIVEESGSNEHGKRVKKASDSSSAESEDESVEIEKIIIKEKIKDKKSMKRGKKTKEEEFVSEESEQMVRNQKGKRKSAKHNDKDLDEGSSSSSSAPDDFADNNAVKAKKLKRHKRAIGAVQSSFTIKFIYDVFNNVVDGGPSISVHKIILHEGFEKTSYDPTGSSFGYTNDIALLQLEHESHLVNNYPAIYKRHLFGILPTTTLMYIAWPEVFSREVHFRKYNEFELQTRDRVDVKTLSFLRNNEPVSLYYDNNTIIGLFSYKGDLTSKCYFSNLNYFQDWIASIVGPQ